MIKSFRGTYTMLITPIDANGSVNLGALRDLTEWQIGQGIHGLIPLGSTGEFLSMSPDERTAIAETVIKTARGRVPVLVGTGAEDTREVVRLSCEAERLGADGVLIIPPFYSTPTVPELVHHYKTVADALSIPIMLYNNPATSNIDLRPEILAKLCEIDGCRYIKESTLEVTRIRDIQRLCGDRMTVFGGILGYESFVSGAAGWTCVASNPAPAAMSRIFELVEAGKPNEARALYKDWFPVIDAVFALKYVAGSKSLLNHMGFAAGPPRPPRLPLPPDEDAAMAALVSKFGLRFTTSS
jgi:4-hydroxy-tetrahydrodipicolinate synthase